MDTRRCSSSGWTGRLDARHRSRQARHPLHADREERRAARLPEDGALQSADDGNLPPPRHCRDGPRRRIPAGLADGHLSAVRPDAAAAVQDGPSTVAEAKARRDATTDGSLPLEPYQIISQYTLEPLLKSVAETIPAITVKFGHEFLSFTEQPDGVTAQIRKTNGEHAAIRPNGSWAGAGPGDFPARCASSSATGWKASPISWRCVRRCSTARSCTTR